MKPWGSLPYPLIKIEKCFFVNEFSQHQLTTIYIYIFCFLFCVINVYPIVFEKNLICFVTQECKCHDLYEFGLHLGHVWNVGIENGNDKSIPFPFINLFGLFF